MIDDHDDLMHVETWKLGTFGYGIPNLLDLELLELFLEDSRRQES